MRIKLLGKITAELLAKALDDATKQHENNNFAGFFGGNLYLTAYNNDGEQFKVISKYGDEMVLSVQAPEAERTTVT